MQRTLALAEDLSTPAVVLVLLALGASLGWLALELYPRRGRRVAAFATGLLALGATLLALLRPTWVTSRRLSTPPNVLVLVDGGRRLSLPEGDTTRWARARDVARALKAHFADADVELRTFGDGHTSPLSLEKDDSGPPFFASDPRAVLRSLGEAELAKAVVLVSDGRFDGVPDVEEWRRRGGPPIHTVAVAESPPRDAALREIRTSGAAVAHQPFTLSVEIGCAGGIACERVGLEVRELLFGLDPVVLARGEARSWEVGAGAAGSRATVVLPITLERAGTRIVEVVLSAPEGDTVPENNRRFLEVSVTRDRVRLLHLAGAPTYDVRALRRWLKSDSSIDLVAYFILRTTFDDPNTNDDDELALIPFPVDQLFTSHISTFDAVLLQDIHAVEYGLDVHFGALERYVKDGGGLVLIGGPRAFAGGGYADTSLDGLLPVDLGAPEVPFDEEPVVPKYTAAGLETPVLGRVVQMLGTELPEMAAGNVFEAARPGAVVLWEHPTRRSRGAALAMLALGEAGDGRVVTLGVDESYKLGFGSLAAAAAGRAYGAFWDGIVGWLMRDPRYEASRLEPMGVCIPGKPFLARLTRAPGRESRIELSLAPLGTPNPRPTKLEVSMQDSLVREVELGPLREGGYSARIQTGYGPASRDDFACEAGGRAFSDSRPDPKLLERIALATGGQAVSWTNVQSLAPPEPDEITEERQVEPLVPPWVWTALAAALLSVHWLVRRRAGLA